MNSKLWLSLCALCGLSCFSMAQTVPSAILPTYVEGVEHFNDTLISLVNYEEDENLKEFFTGLFQSVKSSHEAFSASQEQASAHHTKLNQDQAKVQSQLDSQRANLQNKVTEKAAKETELQGQQQSLQQAERHLQNTEQNLRNLENAVREAQRKVDDARDCLHKRKKRGFGLGSVFREIKRTVKKVRKETKRAGRKLDKHVIRKVAKPVERAVCGVYNQLTGNLRDKKRLRDQAQRDVANYRNTVNQARQAVQNTQARISALNQEIQAVQASITTLNGQITKLGADQQKIVAIKQKITQVDRMLSALVNRMGASVDAIKTSQAALLIAEIEDVIDFENVIQPLVEAGELIAGGSSVVVPKLLQLTPANRQKVVENVAALQAKLNYLKGKYGDNSNLFESLNRE